MDIEAFEKVYQDEHVPMAVDKRPGLSRRGGEDTFYILSLLSEIFIKYPVWTSSLIDFIENCKIFKNEVVVVTRGCPNCQYNYYSFKIPLNPPFSKGEIMVNTPLWKRGARACPGMY